MTSLSFKFNTPCLQWCHTPPFPPNDNRFRGSGHLRLASSQCFLRCSNPNPTVPNYPPPYRLLHDTPFNTEITHTAPIELPTSTDPQMTMISFPHIHIANVTTLKETLPNIGPCKRVLTGSFSMAKNFESLILRVFSSCCFLLICNTYNPTCLWYW